MAFASAFARPASSRFIRPGPASLWFPPRHFPASSWLTQRPASAATPACSAGLRAGLSADGAASPTRGRAARDGGGTSTALPRLDMELRWLFSRYKPAPDEDFFAALRIELGRRAFGDGRLRVLGTRTLGYASRARAWSLEHAIGAPRPAWSATPGDDSDLEKLRARLVTEVNLGLAIVESASVRYPRLVRNVLLVRQARHIGRCLRDLLGHPGAGSFAAELNRLLDALQRRR